MPDKTYKITDAALEQVIVEFCRDITAEAAAGGLQDFAHADNTADSVLQLLGTGGRQASVCITAEPGLGAGRVFDAVAQQIVEGVNVPAALENARVISPEIAAMKAGAKFIGQIETRVQTLFQGLAEREGVFQDRRIIVAANDIDQYFRLGRESGAGGIIFKPFAMAKGISIIATGEPDFCRRSIEVDPALARRFNVMTFVPGDSGQSLAKVFHAGVARDVKVRPPIVLRAKPPALS